MDLLDWFRARRPWPQLLRLIEKLPDHSHYKVALSQDDELARRRAAHPEQAQRPGVDGRVWTPERAVLTDVADILFLILASLESHRTGKKQKPQHMPRPVLARQRVARADALRRHRERVALLTPRRR